MNSIRETRRERPARSQALLATLRAVGLAAAFTLLSAPPAHAISWYSGISVGSDGSVYGWSVTDVTSYFMYDMAHVSTTLTSPLKHRQASNSDTARNATRADVSLPFDPDDTGTYFVESHNTGQCLWCDHGSPEPAKTSPDQAQAEENATPVPGGPAGAQPRTPPWPLPPGTIDGAKTPELIPDDVAYRLVLLGIAEPENATEAQKARFRAKIASARLNEDDTAALLVILAAFQKQLDTLNAQADQIVARNPIPFADTPDYQQLVELSKKREPIFVEALSALPARLSLAGAAQFQAYVQDQKRGMNYLPDSLLPQH